jgi:glycolate dehydrogenase FAD-binding subunit
VSAPRPARPDEAILGVAPREVYEPTSAAEAAEVMRACARDRRRLAFVGGGTDLGVGKPPSALDAVLRTAGLSRVLEHAPSDQIVVAEAGLPLAALQRALGAHGQRLALDPPLAERATVGGVVAANAFGPRRTRYGTARDLIIGISLVRADGVAARGGGKVVKNVAGFDLPRLFVGSLGTLGLITSATFRLHPLPEASATVAIGRPAPAQVRALVVALREAQLEPASVTLVAEGGGLRLGVRFEGFGPGVRQQAARLSDLAARAGLAPEPLDEAGAAAFWARQDALRTSGEVRLRLGAPPSALEGVLRDAVGRLSDGLDGAWAVLDPVVGSGFAGGTAADLPRGLAALGQARAALEALRGSLTLTAAPPSVRAGFDAWGPPPPSLEVMRRLKARLDPEGRLAPGRFVGGI